MGFNLAFKGLMNAIKMIRSCSDESISLYLCSSSTVTDITLLGVLDYVTFALSCKGINGILF